MSRIGWPLIVLAGVIVLAAGAVLWLINSELTFLREPLQTWVSRTTGRNFEIRGQFRLALGTHVVLEAHDIHLGNTEWSSDTDMISADRILLRLNAWSVFDEPIVLELFESDGVRVWLEKADDDRNNWTFGGEAGAEPVALLLREARTSDAAITYRSPALQQPLEIRIESLEQSERADGLLDTVVVGTINDRAAAIRGRIGPFESLLSGTDLEFAVQGRFEGFRFSGRGDVDDLGAPRRPTLRLHLKAASVDELTDALGLRPLSSGGIDLDVSITPREQDLELYAGGHVGEFEFDLQGAASDLTQARESRVSASATGPNLGRFLRVFEVDGVPEEPFQLAIQASRSGPLLTIDELRLDLEEASFDLSGTIARFPGLDGTNLDLEISGSEIAKFRELIKAPGQLTGPFELRGSIKMQANGVDTAKLNLQTDVLQATVDGELGDPPDYLGTRFSFTIGGESFGRMLAIYGVRDMPGVQFAVDGGLEVVGAGFDSSGRARLRLGQQVWNVEGLVSLQPLMRGTDLRFRGDGPNFADLARLARIEQPVREQPYTINGRFRAQPAGYRFDDVDARIGGASLTLDGIISRRDDLLGSNLRFDARGPDLEAILADRVDFDVPAGPFEISGQLQRHDDMLRLIDVEATAGGAVMRADADLGWPVATSERGDFVFEASGPDLRVMLPIFDAYEPGEAPFDIAARGKWRRERWTIDEARAQWGDAQLLAAGQFDQPPDLSATDLDFEATAPTLTALGSVNGKPLPDLPVRLTAHFSGTPSAFQMDRLQGQAGVSDIAGRLALRLDGEIPDLDAELRSSLLDLRQFIGVDEADADTKAETEATERDDQPVIPDYALPLEYLRLANGQLKLAADEFLLPNIGFPDFVLIADLDDGMLQLTEAHGRPPGGRVETRLTVRPAAASANLELVARGTDLSLHLTGETAEDLGRAPRYGLDMELAGAGLTVREIAGNLNGSIDLRTDGGRIRNAGLDLIFADFLSQLIDTLNPFAKKDPYTEIVCAVALFEAENGKIRTAPGLVIQTDKMNIGSTGTIDLRNEELDLNFRTGARKGIGISAGDFVNPFIRVAGTMRNPKLTLNKTNTLITGGAAVMTAGLSLFAKAAWDRAFRAKDPCNAVIDDAREARGQQN